MNKKKIIIIAAVFIVILIIAAIALTTFNPSNDNDQSSTSDEPQRQSSSEGGDEHEEPDDHSHDYEDPDFEPKPTLYLNETEMTPERINSLVVPRAEAAAREYVKQSTSESGSARQARLSKVFTPGSSAIKARKPKVDTSNSPDTQSNPVIVDKSWDTTASHVLVTVFVEVVTVSTESPFNEVSRVYQGYDVTMVDYGDNYRARSISFSDKPLVLRR